MVNRLNEFFSLLAKVLSFFARDGAQYYQEEDEQGKSDDSPFGARLAMVSFHFDHPHRTVCKSQTKRKQLKL